MNIYKTIRASRESYIDSLARLYEYSTGAFAKRKFLNLLDTDTSYTYGEFKTRCDGISKLLSQYGIGAGDKVAVLSPSQPNWAVAMFSCVPFGRIFVPILPDSSESEVTNILTHSETKAIFVSRKMERKISEKCREQLSLIIAIEDFEVLMQKDDHFTCDGRVVFPTPDDIATIIYTSGTTGNAKGVVLSHRNLTECAKSSFHAQKCHRWDVWLSVLPLAHTYELAIGLLYPMYVGASVNYLSKPLATSVLMAAMKEVKPTIILSVPLIIEKVYKASVVPTIKRSRFLSWMDRRFHKFTAHLICNKLVKTFGGKLKFFGIGGAKLDVGVERFLKDGGFPYAIGYGCTETAPLICAATVKKSFPGSIGVPVHGMEAKLYNVDPKTGEGEIVARGTHVMLGYYKDPARTRAAFTPDGWYRTNDLATQDEKGRFFIKGRLNNMILGASGENIYPEEIEHVISDVAGVNESVVLERNGKLIALVQLDEKIINWDQAGEDKFFDTLDSYKKTILDYVNKNVSKSSKVSEVEVMEKPFEKTATQKIRRFLYKNAKGVSRDTTKEESAASVEKPQKNK